VPVRLQVYEGDPPSDEVIRAEFLQGTDYTYVVATAAQERLRMDLAPARQRTSHAPPAVPGAAVAASPKARYDSRTEDVFLTFPKMVRHLMGRPCLTRSEERVLVRRAILDVSATDADRIRLLHDVGPLTDALAELASRGINLAGHEAPPSERFASPQLLVLLRDLQAAMSAHIAGMGATTFEAAAREWLEGAPPLGRLLVLDGFTFLTPLQRLLVDRMAAAGDVVAIFPYRSEQRSAFEVMERTYEPWWPPLSEPLTSAVDPSSALSEAKGALFAAKTGRVSGDGSLRIQGYDHEHDEARACVVELARCVAEYGKDVADHVAIVTPFPHRYDALLQEELALQDLPVQVGIPPRLLLLTPVGRFVLTLYEMWTKDSVQLTAEQFERLLASGWLGMRAQTSAAAFAAARQQVFARCYSLASWEHALRLLPDPEDAPAPSTRLPTSHLEGHERQVWEDALRQVAGMTTRLFSAGPGSIGEHVQRLLQEIQTLGDRELFAEEQAIVEGIREALEESATATTMSMEVEEFGSILTGLAREYEAAAQAEDGERAPDGVRVWVTTPEGIDGHPIDVVILLGADELQLPRPFREGWPLATDTLDEHLAKERYLFLAVVLAARRRLRVSYSRVVDRRKRDASAFLRPVASLPDAGTTTALVVASAPATVAPQPLRPARRASYELTELALFGLCPYRYKMERLSRLAPAHRESFQLRILAQAEWLDAALRSLHGRVLDTATLRKTLGTAASAVQAQVRNILPGLRFLDWLNAERYLQGKLDGITDFLLGQSPSGREQLIFQRPRESGVSVEVEDREVRITATVNHSANLGTRTYAVTDDVVWRAWVLPLRAPEPGPHLTVQKGHTLFASAAHAFHWWGRATRALFLAGNAGYTPPDLPALRGELVTWVQRIESSEYPKRPGDHCRQCPVLHECFGLDAR
jgi:hypothetical protein